MKNNVHFTKAIISALVVSLFLFIVSCKAKEIPPPVNIPTEFVNQQIIVRLDQYLNTFKITDPVSLELKYNSSNKIVFPNNYNLKIYEFSNNAWLEVQEKPTVRLPEGELVFAPNIAMPAVETIFVSPKISDLSKLHRMRIYVIGEMQIESGSQNVAAYVDFELKP
jgi:hypothetical protein